VTADRPFFSGKLRCHGMNLQVLADPAGQLLWVSGELPGSVHDMKAAWIWGIDGELAAAGLLALADKGYQGARENPVPREEQARIAETGQPRPRETPGPWGKGQTPSSKHGRSSPGYTAALARRPDRQNHPRFAGSRDQNRMKKAQ
jgi:hypothetical protein